MNTAHYNTAAEDFYGAGSIVEHCQFVLDAARVSTGLRDPVTKLFEFRLEAAMRHAKSVQTRAKARMDEAAEKGAES